jgi:hypothetical protein
LVLKLLKHGIVLAIAVAQICYAGREKAVRYPVTVLWYTPFPSTEHVIRNVNDARDALDGVKLRMLGAFGHAFKGLTPLAEAVMGEITNACTLLSALGLKEQSHCLRSISEEIRRLDVKYRRNVGASDKSTGQMYTVQNIELIMRYWNRIQSIIKNAQKSLPYG